MTKHKRNLVFCWNYLDWGGAQVYLLGIMKAARNEWNITTLLPRGSDPKVVDFLEQTGVRYEFLSHFADLRPAPTIARKLARRWSILRSELEVSRRLRQFDPGETILHIEAAPWHSAMLIMSLALSGMNVFLTVHNSLPPGALWREFLWRTRMRMLSGLSRFHIFASNKDTKKELARWVTARFLNTVKVTYTCVDPTEIESAKAAKVDLPAVRQRFGIATEAFVVLCVGQFIDRKGRWTFLEAAKLLETRAPDTVFVWLSPQPPDAAAMARVEAAGLGERFKLVLSDSVGAARADILEFLRIADMFALPSFVEGLPIALLEAMAMGLPSVSTRINAIPEAVIDRQTGILVEPGDAVSLSEAILELKTDPELRKRLSEHGSKFVLEHFDERAASRIAIDEYEKCFQDAD